MAKAAAKKRVAFCEGEEERVLRAAQIIVDEQIARPTFIARPAIAVLPFRALDDEARARAVAAGVSHDLASLFARWCWFPVLVRSGACRPYALALGRGNETLVPAGALRWSGALAHHSGTAVPGAAGHRPGCNGAATRPGS